MTTRNKQYSQFGQEENLCNLNDYFCSEVSEGKNGGLNWTQWRAEDWAIVSECASVCVHVCVCAPVHTHTPRLAEGQSSAFDSPVPCT